MEPHDGIFLNYIKTFPQTAEEIFRAIEHMVEQGTGGAILDQLARKTFKDTKTEYLNRIKNEAYRKEDGIYIILEALISWYETWKDTFKDFHEKNAIGKYNERPIHTWLHCLFTGQLDLYYNKLAKQELVIVPKADFLKESKKEGIPKPSISTEDVSSSEQKERIERLLKLYEMDPEIQVREHLVDKKIAVFLENKWNQDRVEEIQKKYHLQDIGQLSSIDVKKDPGSFDFYLFLTLKRRMGEFVHLSSVGS